MNKLLCSFLIMLLPIGIAFAQSSLINSLELVDLHNIQRAEAIAQLVLGDSVQHATYFVFIMNHELLLVHKKDSDYRRYRLSQSFDKVDKKATFNIVSSQRLEDDDILKRVFSENPCTRRFTYSNTDSLVYKHDLRISYMYFVLCKEGEKVCEFNLPITVTPGFKGPKYPLQKGILDYLIEILFYRFKT